MARKRVEMKTRPRAKPLSFGSDTEKKLPAVKQGSGGAGAKPVSTALDEPSARPLAKRGRSEITRPGRPSMDVDGRQKRLPGFKDVTGPAERVSKPALPSPKPTATSGLSSASKVGMGARALTGLGALAYSPDVGAGSDKPRNYPGEGLSPVGPPKPAAKAPAAAAPKPAAPKPAAPKPAATVKPARTSTKPVPRVPKPSRANVEREAFLKDLRESARKMKDTSSEMAGATGRMKEKMGEFAGSFKKGGSVKSRGDGIAQRGKTKGRFV